MMQWLRDLWLEYRIWRTYRKWLHTGEPERRYWLHFMNNMIGKRSPRQVAKMERNKGLA